METITDVRWDALKTASRGLGDSHGRAAASWFEIPDEATARHILKGIEDCNPEVMDELPGSPLSGEYADDYSPRALYRDLDISGDADSDDKELCWEYETAWYSAVEDEIARRALLMLED